MWGDEGRSAGVCHGAALRRQRKRQPPRRRRRWCRAAPESDVAGIVAKGGGCRRTTIVSNVHQVSTGQRPTAIRLVSAAWICTSASAPSTSPYRDGAYRCIRDPRDAAGRCRTLARWHKWQKRSDEGWRGRRRLRPARRLRPGQAGAVTQVGSSRASVASGNDPCPSTWSWNSRRSKRDPSRAAIWRRSAWIWRWPSMYVSA